MFESELFKMYHAWLQGNERHSGDWMKFVEWAATWNKTTTDIMMEELFKYKWFKHD